jgi:hypothetical protein
LCNQPPTQRVGAPAACNRGRGRSSAARRKRGQHATGHGDLAALSRGVAGWPVHRRRRAGPAHRKLPYATSAWLAR